MSTNYNILTENDKQITQPKYIKVELMSHQKTMIQKMLEIEESGKIDIDSNIKFAIDIPIKSFSINTNFAVLGDKVGSGKTLMITSLLSIRKKIKDRDIEYGINPYYSLKLKSNSMILDTNLIIVPHKLIPQWHENFEKNVTNIKVLTITTNKDIDSLVKTIVVNDKNIKEEYCFFQYEEIISERVNCYDVILIGETMYRRFYRACEKFKFNRIIIDEADSIKLPKDLCCQFNFMWLVTGTPSGLFYTSNHFIAKLFKNNYHLNSKLNDCFIFKNDEKFIEQSIILPNPKRLKIKCITPKELNIIKDVIPSSILQMINAGNSEQAIKALNCNVDTNENILQVVTKNIFDSIKNKELEYESETKKVYPFGQQKEHESKIKFIENQIFKLQEKYNDIKKKIYDLNDSHCPVCMGEFTSPVITECCKSCFCFDCLAISLGELKTNKCPNCRQTITQSTIHVITDNKEELIDQIDQTKKYELKDKLDVLVDLIQMKPDGTFMVFANWAETFVKIEQKLKELGITYHILKGQASIVKKNIDDFRDKKVRVLMLNAEFFGAGMNLQMTTDLVMFHRFKHEMEEQIIGRAQRLGRTTSLNVYYLLHENESNDILNNFNFDDQGSIHYMDWLENNHSSNTILNKEFEEDNNKMVNSSSSEFTKICLKYNTNTQNNIESVNIVDEDSKVKKIKHNKKTQDLNEEYMIYKTSNNLNDEEDQDPEEFINSVKKNIFIEINQNDKQIDINFDEFEIIT